MFILILRGKKFPNTQYIYIIIIDRQQKFKFSKTLIAISLIWGVLVYQALVWHASAKTEVLDLLYICIFQNAEIKLSKSVKQYYFLLILQNSPKIKQYFQHRSIFFIGKWYTSTLLNISTPQTLLHFLNYCCWNCQSKFLWGIKPQRGKLLQETELPAGTIPSSLDYGGYLRTIKLPVAAWIFRTLSWGNNTGDGSLHWGSDKFSKPLEVTYSPYRSDIQPLQAMETVFMKYVGVTARGMNLRPSEHSPLPVTVSSRQL